MSDYQKLAEAIMAIPSTKECAVTTTQDQPTEPLENSLEDWAMKALVSIYICIDANVADDLNQRVKAFIHQLKRERDEARLARDIQGKVAVDLIAERDQLRKVCDELATACLIQGQTFAKMPIMIGDSGNQASLNKACEIATDVLAAYNNLPHVKKENEK